MEIILLSILGTLGYINYQHYREDYIIKFNLPKIAVLDIFILLWSSIPFIYVFLFWIPNITSNEDMVLMIYQSVVLMWYALFTVLIPQINTRLSRIMIMYMTVLQLYSATSLYLHFRPKFLGSTLDSYQWATILIIYFVSFIFGILLEPLARNFLTKFKQTNTYED